MPDERRSVPPTARSEAANAPILADQILEEIIIAFGVSPNGLARRLISPLFRPPAKIFAGLMAGTNEDILQYGLPEAARRLLPRFAHGVQVHGASQIPDSGPLIVASNHPGAFDGVAILASLPRDDIKVIVSDVAFFRNLPGFDQHAIYTGPTEQTRMGAVRGMLRQLQAGGMVLIFPSGLVDPDPAFLPGAAQKLGAWSPSLEIALRRVPQTRLLPVIVSSVLAPACFRNPLTHLQREPWKAQKLAEFIQVIQQIFFHRDFNLRPKISFGQPLDHADLLANTSPGYLPGADTPSALLQEIIRQARDLLEDHRAAFYPAMSSV